MANGGDKTAAEVQALVDALKEQLIVERELGEEGLKMFAELEKQENLLKEMLKLQAERIKNGEVITEGERESLKTQMKNIEAEKERINQIKKGRDALKDLGGEFDSVLSKVTGIGEGWKTGVLGGIDKAIESGATMGDVFKEFGSSIARTFSLKNLAMSFVGNFIQQTTLAIMSVDQARADFVKAAGTTLTGDQTAMLTDLADAQNKFGQTIESTTKNYGVLMQTVSGFRNLSQSTQEEVLAAAGQFEALGIAAEDTGQFINFATKAMGMSETEAVGMQKRLVGLSREVSASGTQLMQQMQQMEGDLAQFGSNMEQEFANLAKTADKTGASMQDLVSIAKQFDTFKGAAQAVGKLNTLIGKNVLNMKEMVGLSFDERVKMLAKRAEQAGVSFETMGRQRKLAFASALGTDVATMMKVMTGAADAQKAKLDELNLSQEDMNELAEKATPMMLMLKASFQKFIIALEPVITVVREVIEYFASLDKETIQLIGGIVIGIFVLKQIAGVFSALGTILTPFTALLPAIGGGMASTSGGIAAMGAASLKAAPGLLVLTLLIGVIGGAIYLVTTAFAELFGALGQLGEGFVEIGLKLALMGALFPLILAGALGLAAGLAVAALGFLALAFALAFIKTEDLQAIATIFESVAKTTEKKDPFEVWTTGLTKFVKTIDDMGKSSWKNLDTLAAKLSKLPAAADMSSFSIDKLMASFFDQDQDYESLSKIFTTIAETTENNPFESWVSGLNNFIEALSKIDENILTKLTQLSFGTLMLSSSVKEIDTSKIEALSGITEIGNVNIEGIEAAKGLIAELKLTAEQEGVLAVAAALNSIGSAFDKKQETPPIVVKIGDKVILDIVEKGLNKKNSGLKAGLAKIAGIG